MSDDDASGTSPIADRPPIVRTVDDLRRHVRRWRADGDSVALVPTMGALHNGHLALVRLAHSLARRTCVSLFVNPKQFGPTEDFERYPRDQAGDATKLAAIGVDLLYAPEQAEMYPPGSVTRVVVPGLGDDLEGRFRPGFFDGVATVVCKLLLQTLPDVAVFGEKDYQQLQVVRRLVADLDIPTRIAAGATVREADGLALSSRNAYLSAAERMIAPALHRTLTAVADRISAGDVVAEAVALGTRDLLDAGFGRVDYIEVRDADSLEPWPGPRRPGRVLGAAWLGRTRLIDNVPLVRRDARFSPRVG